ncbi:MAG: metalloregulator ArsR/SmtB family transcription factor, partial [Proteobacteria bacterium]|nr:metalloregulator ArsR/SmtB family transcription factor [Pseudomonadota bacterium]
MNPDSTIKALAVPVRRRLFELICERPHFVSELAAQVPVSRPAVSQHLAVLSDAGLVDVTPVGTRNLYTAAPLAASGLRSWLDDMWSIAFGTFGDFVVDGDKETPPMDHQLSIQPVVKVLELNVSPRRAFDLFALHMDDWWPVLTHSVAADNVREIIVDDHAGGTIREVTNDGVEHEWATLTQYVRGERIQFNWYPGATAVQATHVDIRFDETAAGSRVTLIHSGWETRGEDGQRLRDNYESGWDVVLDPYV